MNEMMGRGTKSSHDTYKKSRMPPNFETFGLLATYPIKLEKKHVCEQP